MGCREEILEALPAVLERTGGGPFSPQDVVNELARRGSGYSASTVRTHVVSRMCMDSPDNHGTVYADLRRVSPGRYRLLHE